MADEPGSSHAAGRPAKRGRGRPRGAARAAAAQQPLHHAPRPQRVITWEDVLEEPDADDLMQHPLLRFGLLTDEREEADRLTAFALLQQRYIDLGAVAAVTPDRSPELRDLLGERWIRVLSYDQPAYRQLTIEFHATFQQLTGEYDHPQTVTFSLGRQLRTMTTPALGHALGFYTEEEIQTEEFRSARRGLLSTRCPDHGVTEHQLRDFWVTIADGVYSDNLLESSILDPLLRYVHRLLSTSILGRRSGTEKVSKSDLFCLYCIVNRLPVNFACLFLTSCRRGFRIGRDTRLSLGPYITRLAEHFHVFDTYPREGMQSRASVPFSLAMLQSATMVTESDPPTWVPTRVRVAAPPPPAPHRFRSRHDRGLPPLDLPPRRLRPDPLTIETLWESMEDQRQILEDTRQRMEDTRQIVFGALEEQRSLIFQGLRTILEAQQLPIPPSIADPPPSIIERLRPPPPDPAGAGDPPAAPQ